MRTISNGFVRRARKQHKCFCCCEPIHVGASYSTSTHISDGKVYRLKIHNCCNGLVEEFELDRELDGFTTADFEARVIEEYYKYNQERRVFSEMLKFVKFIFL